MGMQPQCTVAATVVASMKPASSEHHTRLPGRESKFQRSNHSVSANHNIHLSALSINYVTWPVLLVPEVLYRVSFESEMINALSSMPDQLLVMIGEMVVMPSPASDFRMEETEKVVLARSSRMEYLNEMDSPSPPYQQFFCAIRVELSCQNNLLTSGFESQEQREMIASVFITALAPPLLQTLNTTMRFCR